MSRGGANPNWEYQLVSSEGHTKDSGLRQRAILNGTYKPGRAHKKVQAKKAAKRKERALNLQSLFKLLKREQS